MNESPRRAAHNQQECRGTTGPEASPPRATSGSAKAAASATATRPRRGARAARSWPEFDYAAVTAMIATETRTPKRWTLLVWSSPTSLVLRCWLPGSPKCHPLALLSVSEHKTRGSYTRPGRWRLLPLRTRSSGKPAPARSTVTLQNHLLCFNYTYRAFFKKLRGVFMFLNKHTKH